MVSKYFPTFIRIGQFLRRFLSTKIALGVAASLVTVGQVIGTYKLFTRLAAVEDKQATATAKSNITFEALRQQDRLNNAVLGILGQHDEAIQLLLNRPQFGGKRK